MSSSSSSIVFGDVQKMDDDILKMAQIPGKVDMFSGNRVHIPSVHWQLIIDRELASGLKIKVGQDPDSFELDINVRVGVAARDDLKMCYLVGASSRLFRMRFFFMPAGGRFSDKVPDEIIEKKEGELFVPDAGDWSCIGNFHCNPLTREVRTGRDGASYTVFRFGSSYVGVEGRHAQAAKWRKAFEDARVENPPLLEQP